MVESTKYMIVKKAVDSADPYGLLKIGAPDDEYEVEAAYIAEAISPGDPEEKIAEIAAKIFAKENLIGTSLPIDFVILPVTFGMSCVKAA